MWDGGGGASAFVSRGASKGESRSKDRPRQARGCRAPSPGRKPGASL